MTTLTDLYTKVRTQTDTIATELPDPLIKEYLAEAFNRTVAAENQWPSYEQIWDLTLTAGATTITLPGDVNEPAIIGLWDVDNERRLVQLPLEKTLDFFADKFSASSFGPHVYTLWAREIRLYPDDFNFTEDKDYKLYGFRLATGIESLTDTDEPDCDSRLHLPLAHYATALAYAREEDEMLENQYMQRWQRDVEMARQAIMEESRHRPLTMGPDFVTSIGPWPYRRTWNPGVVINTP